MQSTPFGGHQIQIYSVLGQQFLNVVGLFQVNCDLEREPTIRGTFIDVCLHFEQLIENIGGFVEDGVVECSPALLAQFIDYKGFAFLQLDQLILLDIFGVILEDV